MTNVSLFQKKFVFLSPKRHRSNAVFFFCGESFFEIKRADTPESYFDLNAVTEYLAFPRPFPPLIMSGISG